MDRSLSASDIFYSIRKKCNIWLYEELHDMNNINELFISKSHKILPCIILYPISHDMGHWVSIIKKKDSIEFFDPYGMHIDTQLKLCYKKMLPYLSNLIKKSKLKVICNTYRFQKLAPNINTCGRWCLLRCWLWNQFRLSLSDMQVLFNNEKDIDKIVTYITKF